MHREPRYPTTTIDVWLAFDFPQLETHRPHPTVQKVATLSRRLSQEKVRNRKGLTGRANARPMTGSAKAEYPVRCGLSIQSLASRSTGSPAFAGDDGWRCRALAPLHKRSSYSA